MPTQNLLFKREFRINDYIGVTVPRVGEVLDDEDNYYSLVAMLTAMPIDMMVQLDDIGIDFTTINDYELFLILFDVLKEMDTSLVFGELDLQPFRKMVNTQNNQIVLVDNSTGAKIDRAIHGRIASALRKMHHLEKNNRKPGNGEAKEYMLHRAREKMRRNKNRMTESQLEKYIVALVNTAEFPYGYEGTRELSIYQFNLSLRQIIHKIDYDNRMHGIYSGTVDAKKLSQDELTWLLNK